MKNFLLLIISLLSFSVFAETKMTKSYTESKLSSDNYVEYKVDQYMTITDSVSFDSRFKDSKNLKEKIINREKLTYRPPLTVFDMSNSDYYELKSISGIFPKFIFDVYHLESDFDETTNSYKYPHRIKSAQKETRFVFAIFIIILLIFYVVIKLKHFKVGNFWEAYFRIGFFLSFMFGIFNVCIALPFGSGGIPYLTIFGMAIIIPSILLYALSLPLKIIFIILKLLLLLIFRFIPKKGILILVSDFGKIFKNPIDHSINLIDRISSIEDLNELVETIASKPETDTVRIVDKFARSKISEMSKKK